MDIDDAIEAGDVTAVRELLQQGVDLQRMGRYDSTPLSNAAAQGNLEIVRLLLDAGADPNLGGCTSVLGRAALHGHADVVRLLLQAGADVNEVDEEGELPIWSAAFSGSLDAVQALIAAGANPAVEGYEGQTPAEVARARGFTEVAAYLDGVAGTS